CPLDASVFDFSQTDQLLQRAYQSTQTWIEGTQLIRTGVRVRCRHPPSYWLMSYLRPESNWNKKPQSTQ
ncbi:MAG: hypothetical protein RSG92_28195, partial [Pseudomonas sp.]